MSESTSTRKWWLYFFIFAVIILIMLVLPPLRPWFWLALPFVLTTFVKAMRLM